MYHKNVFFLQIIFSLLNLFSTQKYEHNSIIKKKKKNKQLIFSIHSYRSHSIWLDQEIDPFQEPKIVQFAFPSIRYRMLVEVVAILNSI